MEPNQSVSNQSCSPGTTVPENTLAVSPNPQKLSPPVSKTKTDFFFALLWCVLGYGFVHVFTSGWQPGLSLYTVIYAAAVLCFVSKNKLKPPKESWFWLAILLCIGIPLPYYSVLGIVQLYALIVTAAYYTLSVSGVLLSGGTSNWVLLDCLNALCGVPFGNFINHPQVLMHGIRRTRPGRNILMVCLGLLISLPLLGVILPLLSGADSRFSNLFTESSYWVIHNLGEFLLRFGISLPITFFLYGLIHGAIHRRRTATYNKEKIAKVQEGLHFLPNLAVATALCLVCGIYLLFIALQSSYLFSAFRGVLPEGFSYAEYARQGFFELCSVTGFNIFILLCTNMLCKASHKENKGIRLFNLILSGLSLLLIATAASKMGLYIISHGLTEKRVIPSVFMLWLTVVLVLIIIRQFRAIRLVRLAVFAGAVLFCLLCVFNISAFIYDYNSMRVAAGTLLSPGYL